MDLPGHKENYGNPCLDRLPRVGSNPFKAIERGAVFVLPKQASDFGGWGLAS